MSARSERAGHDPQGSDTRQPDGTGTRAKQGRELSDDDEPATVFPQPVQPDGSTREKKRPRVRGPSRWSWCVRPASTQLALATPHAVACARERSLTVVSLMYHRRVVWGLVLDGQRLPADKCMPTVLANACPLCS